MRQAEDLVWNAITQSARERFDYDEFKNKLSASGDERIADYILFQIIAGYAEELPRDEFLSKIRGDLQLFGYSVPEDELTQLLAGKQDLLLAEIGAAKEVLSGFANGVHADELLVDVRRSLKRKTK